MTRVHQVLALALLAQLGLGAVTWRSTVGSEPTPLHVVFSIDPVATTAIEITGRTTPDKAATPVRLEKQGDAWIIASSHGYPADAAKVTEVLDKIEEIQARDPIATRAVTHRDLEVADDAFTRKILVTASGTDHHLLLGSSKGQVVNVRLPGSDDVFAARGLTAYALPDVARRFWKPEFIDLKADDLSTWTVTNANGTRTLSRAGGSWSMADLPPGHSVVQAEVDALARMLLTVRIADVVGTAVTPGMGLDGTTSVRWTREADGQSEAGGYVVGALVDGKRYVKADDQPWVIQVTDSSIKRAVETTFDFVSDGTPDFIGQIGDPDD
jgi:hypothetical protein